MRWLEARNQYYTDVTIDQIRLSALPDGSRVRSMAVPLPQDKCPTPDQTMPGGAAAVADYETGGMLLPEVAPVFRDEVRKPLGTTQLQGDKGKTHAESPWPKTGADPVCGYKTRGFSMAPLATPRGRRALLWRSPIRGGIHLREVDCAPFLSPRRKV